MRIAAALARGLGALRPSGLAGRSTSRRVGYLFLLSTADEHVTAFERSVEMQNRLGLPSRMVSADEARELSPLAGLDGVLAGAFCPLAGHATPDGAVQGYAERRPRARSADRDAHEVTGLEPERCHGREDR